MNLSRFQDTRSIKKLITTHIPAKNNFKIKFFKNYNSIKNHEIFRGILNNDVKDMYSENYKTLLIEIR